MTNKAKQKGFTLVEVVTVVALIGILAAIAVPSFLNWLPNIRLNAAARNFYSNMQMGKTEAIKRNGNVVVLINAVNCPGLPNAVPNAGGGYQLFVDDGSGGGTAGNNVQDGTELTLAAQVMPRNSALCLSTFANARTGFTPRGFVISNNTGTITLNNDQNRSFQLSLTFAGGIRLQ